MGTQEVRNVNPNERSLGETAENTFITTTAGHCNKLLKEISPSSSL